MWPLLPALLAMTPLTFDQALGRADSAPEVTAAHRATATHEEALDRLGSMTSNPQLQLQPGLRHESRVARPEGLLMLQQSFNLAGLASARKETAARELDAARWEARGRRRDLRIAAARAWLETWALSEAARAVQEEETMARELLLRIEKVVASDGLTRVDLESARAFAAEARAAYLTLEGQAIDAGGRLANLLGLDDIVSAEGAPPPLDDASALLPEPTAPSPGVKRLEAQVAGERSRGVETGAQHGTGLQVQLGGGYEAPGQLLANVALGVTLPLFDVGLRERSAHEAQAQLLEGELAKARAGAKVALAMLRHELEHAAEVHDTVAGRQLPAAAEAANLQLRRFQGGEATLQDLLVARRLAVAARVEAIRARADLLAARAHVREVMAAATPGDGR